MKVLSIKLTALRNDEHFEFFSEFIELVKETGVANLQIVKPFNAFTTIFSEEDEALKKIIKSDITRLIHNADEVRDSLFRGMADANRTALNHFRPGIREAAIRLQIVFDTYGNLSKKPVDEETSSIYNLLGELEKNHAEDMTAVALKEWAEELRLRNNVVRALTMERDSETAARPVIVLRRVRSRVDEAYRLITNRIEVFAQIDQEGDAGDDDDNNGTIPPIELSAPIKTLMQPRTAEKASHYDTFFARLNAMITRYNNRIAARKAGAENNPPTTLP
jgi:hypothetical protein